MNSVDGEATSIDLENPCRLSFDITKSTMRFVYDVTGPLGGPGDDIFRPIPWQSFTMPSNAKRRPIGSRVETEIPLARPCEQSIDTISARRPAPPALARHIPTGLVPRADAKGALPRPLRKSDQKLTLIVPDTVNGVPG